jgi:2-polyprenyl-3-methyl-5-hydroxy-6-metoxy-1,4-benzoquinol methylase
VIPGPTLCSSCGSPRIRRRYRLARFEVFACDDCTVQFRHPLPSAAELHAMYEDPRYHASQYFDEPGPRSPELRIFRRGLADLAELVPVGRLLDVGCARGTFLALARAAGWQAEGIELSHRHVELARERGLTVFEGDIATAALPAGSYQAVTMWDVLEHVNDPAAVLASARRLLAPGGVLLVFTIDSTSLFNVAGDVLFGVTGGRAVRPLELLYDARHNHYFTRAALVRVLGDAGFHVERWRTDRAYLGRWVSEPAPWYLFAGGFLLDVASLLVRRPYRRTAYCRTAEPS